jgi:Zn-dependent peptidase ImmA (M78 family)/DNA-binding XRE family transcriptional regulator
MFGERLQIARKQAGLSLRALSDQLDGHVSAQAIGKYERGEMMPSSGVHIRLAKALNVPMDFFAAPVGAKLSEVDFRKHSGTTAKERSMVEVAVLQQVERYLQVENVLGLESTHWDMPFEQRYLSNVEEAEDLATEVRREWSLGIDPIPNLTELLEEHGVKVLMLDLPEKVSGLTCLVERPDGDPVPVIVANNRHGLERRRMTLAHELAHRVLVAESKIVEKAATRFAGAFLMPGDHVRRKVGASRRWFGVPEIVTTKRLYRVSAAATVVRFRDLGILANEKMTRIFMSIGRRWKSLEPEPLETNGRLFERPKRFERLCYRALAEDLISISKAAELLQMPVTKIEAAMSGDVDGVENRHQ